MAPRLQALLRLRPAAVSRNLQCSQCPPAFLLPFLSSSNAPPVSTRRNASILSSLRDNSGAIRHKRRVGRGASSSKGKTSGRGHKGQKQKGGKIPKNFEGGQTKQSIVNPVGGFKNNFAVDLTPLNLSKLQNFINQSRIDPRYPITIRELKQSRIVGNVKEGVKLLAKGSEDLNIPLIIIVSRASASAIAAVEAAGGKVYTRYYTPFAIRQIMNGKMDPVNSLKSVFPEEVARAAGMERVPVKGRGKESEVQLERKKYLYRLPDPTKRKEIEYYRDPAHRGYLAHTVQEGQTPSLFWKVPRVVERGEKVALRVRKTLAENRLF